MLDTFNARNMVVFDYASKQSSDTEREAGIGIRMSSVEGIKQRFNKIQEDIQAMECGDVHNYQRLERLYQIRDNLMSTLQKVK